MVITGVRLAPQATLAPWHAAIIIVGTFVLALTKIADLKAQIEAHRALSTSLAFD